MDESQRLNAVAQVYDSEAGRLNIQFVSHYTLEIIRPLIRAGDSVLLMGIGDGYIASSLSQWCTALTIVEGSRRVIDKFGKPNDRCIVVESLFEDFEPQETFDVVVGTHVLEHVDDPIQVLKQTTRWLSKRGVAVFTVPNAVSLHRRIGKEMGLLPTESSLNEQDLLHGHRRVFDSGPLERDLRAAGYNQVEISGYWLKIVPNHMMKEWSRELLDAIFSVSLCLPRDMCADLLAKCRI